MNCSLTRIIFCLILPITIFLTGCASAPTQDQISRANYGHDMRPEECIALAEKTIANSLKDPNSAQFRHGAACYKGYWDSIPVLGMNAVFGWIQVGAVNGKNSYGGYSGFQQYQVLMNNGIAVRFCISDKDGLCLPVGR